MMLRQAARRRAAAVLTALVVLTVLTGCGYWRPFNDAVVGRTQTGVEVVEFGGAGTVYRGRALTTTDGQTWRKVLVPEVTFSSGLPGLRVRTEDCVPGQPERCYRVVAGQARVQETADGGRHWTTAWELTAGRTLFLRRGDGYGADSTGAAPRLESTSLVLLPAAAGYNAGYTVVVADQNDGLVLRRPDGRWARVGLAGEADDPGGAVPDTGLGRNIGKEYLLALSAAGLALLAGLGAARLRRPDGRPRRAVLAAEGARMLLGALWAAGLDLADGFSGEPGTGAAAVMLLLTCCVLTALVLLRRTWPATRALSLVLAGSALVVGLLTLLPFLGWTVARPDSYTLACWLALGLAGCGTAVNWLLGHRLSAAARH
ncbi:hypothetical protein [Streptacidiphilus alkalitolerans]